MSKPKPPTHAIEEMRPEYDFRGGVRGKHAKAMQAGYTITIHQEDGTTTVQEVEPRKGTVVLDPDVLAYFSDSAAVNHALRTLITFRTYARRANYQRSPTFSKSRTSACCVSPDLISGATGRKA